MKVALVNQPWNDAVPPVETGSVAIWNYRMALALAGSCQVLLCARASPASRPAESSEGVRFRRFSTATDTRLLPLVRQLSPLLGTPFFASGWYYSSYTKRVGEALAAEQPDVIHAHNLAQMIPVLAGRCPDAKLVLHMHCEWLTQLKRRRVEARIRRADLIVGCSDHITNGIRDAFPALASRCRTINNGVDTTLFRPADPRPETSPRILFVGRITPEKGLHVLIEAFARVVAERPDAELEIVGPDAPTPYEFIAALAADPRVRELAPHYRVNYPARLRACLPPALEGRVVFRGPLPQTRLPGIYRRASILVNPSLSESFGMSLVEAMACGVPVIGARVGGMPEVVQDGRTGLLVEPGDADALARAIIGLLGDDEHRSAMAAAARIWAVERYSWERVAAALVEAYRSVTG